jgi:WD40 repeat protein
MRRFHDKSELSKQPSQFRWDAFVSYSHLDDQRLVRSIHNGLQYIAIPFWKVRGRKVFLDRYDNRVGQGLNKSIHKALSSARYFVLLASPSSANSQWVNDEIKEWISMHGHDRILIALIDGKILWDKKSKDFDWKITTALPEILKNRFDKEPIWSDFTGILPKDRTLRNPTFMESVASIACTIVGKSQRELLDAGLRTRVRNRNVGISVGCLIILLVSIAMGLFARDQVRRFRDAMTQQVERLCEDARSLDTRGEDTAAISKILEAEKLVREHRLQRITLVEQTLRKVLETPYLQNQIVIDTLHPSKVTLSTNGKICAVAGIDGNLAIIDLDSNKRICKNVSEAAITAIAFAADNNIIFVGTADGQLLWFDKHTSDVKCKIRCFSSVESIAINPSDPELAVVDEDGRIFLLSTAAESQPEVLYTTESLPLVAWSEDGRNLIVASEVEILVWEQGEAKLRLVARHEITGVEAILSMAVVKKADRIVVALISWLFDSDQVTYRTELVQFNGFSFKSKIVYKSKWRLQEVMFYDKGLAAVENITLEKSMLHLWCICDIETPHDLHKQSLPHSVAQICTDRSGDRLTYITNSEDHIAILNRNPSVVPMSLMGDSTNDPIHSITFLGERDNQIAFINSIISIRLWDWSLGCRTDHNHDDSRNPFDAARVTCLTSDPENPNHIVYGTQNIDGTTDEHCLYYVSQEKGSRRWLPSSPKVKHSAGIEMICFDRLGLRFASADAGKNENGNSIIHVWRRSDTGDALTLIDTIKLPSGITALVFGRSTNEIADLAVGTDDGDVIIHRVGGGSVELQTKKHLFTGPVEQLVHAERIGVFVAFSRPQSIMYVSPSSDPQMLTFAELKPEDRVTCIALSPVEECFALGTEDGRIGLWAKGPSSTPYWLKGPDVSSRCISFDESGNLMAVGFQNGTIKTWPSSTSLFRNAHEYIGNRN